MCVHACVCVCVCVCVCACACVCVLVFSSLLIIACMNLGPRSREGNYLIV